MEPTYTYINSPQYIKSLSFDYVETYSFQRGDENEKNRKLFLAEYEKLKVRKQKKGSLNPDEEDELARLYALFGVNQYLVSDDGVLHPSARKTHMFRHGHPATEQIKQILRTEVVDVPRWMCTPVYRDGLIFYDSNHQIVSTLNVCLSCQDMEIKAFHHVDADYKTYDLLKRFFVGIGHEVEG